jgi:hypothetical protein
MVARGKPAYSVAVVWLCHKLSLTTFSSSISGGGNLLKRIRKLGETYELSLIVRSEYNNNGSAIKIVNEVEGNNYRDSDVHSCNGVGHSLLLL